MKTKLILLACACAGLFTGCAWNPSTGFSPLTQIGGTNTSWRFKNPKISVMGNTMNITADEWVHIGASGNQIVDSATNATNVVATPTDSPTVATNVSQVVLTTTVPVVTRTVTTVVAQPTR